MFAALARLMYRRRWWTLGASGLVLIGVIAALAWGGTLTTGAIEGTESERAQRLVEGLAGLSGDSVIAAVVGLHEQDGRGYQRREHQHDQPDGRHLGLLP